jgi:hypothetical protein
MQRPTSQLLLADHKTRNKLITLRLPIKHGVNRKMNSPYAVKQSLFYFSSILFSVSSNKYKKQINID